VGNLRIQKVVFTPPLQQRQTGGIITMKLSANSK